MGAGPHSALGMWAFSGLLLRKDIGNMTFYGCVDTNMTLAQAGFIILVFRLFS